MSTSDIAESLLKFMREPSAVVTKASEVCLLRHREIQREVSLTLRPDTLAAKDGRIYLDILHVPQGLLVEITVNSPAGRIVSHEEHLEVSELLIQYRFLKLWQSASIESGDLGDFDLMMAAAMDALAQIPRLGPIEAKAVLSEHFESGNLRAVVDTPGVSINHAFMQGLYLLCKRLRDKYLVLMSVKIDDLRDSQISFGHMQEVTASDGKALNASGRTIADPTPNKRHLKYATQPTAFRVHIPWAKRTNHYTFSMDPAEGYFIASQVILVRTASGIRPLKRRGSSAIMWSFSQAQGRRTHVFVGRGDRIKNPMFVGIQNTELPGRSTSRVFSLAWAVVLVMAGFALLHYFGYNRVFEVGALVLALIAAGSFASAPPAGGGVLGSPMLSRFTPPTLAILIVIFTFWLALGELKTPTWLPQLAGDYRAALSLIWRAFVNFGFVVPLLGAAVLAVWLSVRRRKLIRIYTQVNVAKPFMSANLKEGTK